MNTKRPGGLLAAALTVAALTLAPGQPAAAAHERPAPAAVTVHDGVPGSFPGGPTTARPPLVSETYAAREADAPKLATFEGGDRVILASSTVVIILLVVLIVVLL